MSGQNAARKSNRLKEWWGRRPYFGCSKGGNAGINKFYKRCTHKIERANGAKDIENQLIEPDRDEDIIFEFVIWD